MITACLILATGVCFATISTIIIYKKQLIKAIVYSMLGINIIISILIYPMYRENYDMVSSVAFSLLYALRSFVCCQAIELTHNVAID